MVDNILFITILVVMGLSILFYIKEEYLN